MTATRPRIELVVDELVLEGVPPDAADAVVAAFRARLGALATDAPDADDDPARAGSRGATDPAALGRRAADEVWRATAQAHRAPATAATAPARARQTADRGPATGAPPAIGRGPATPAAQGGR